MAGSGFADIRCNVSELEMCGTFLPFAHATIADAAFLRVCGTLTAALRPKSPKRSFISVCFMQNVNRYFAGIDFDKRRSEAVQPFAAGATRMAPHGSYLTLTTSYLVA